MKEVTEKEFYDFMKSKLVSKIQGDVFHSYYYVDEDNIKIAYMETSSWNTDIIYKINPDYVNQEASIFITEQLNKLL